MYEIKTVLYVGNFSFPYGNAAGKRVYANGKLLRELGYEVIFIGVDNDVSSAEQLENTRKEFDGFSYYNLPYPKDNIGWIQYKQVFNKLVNFLSAEKLIDSLKLIVYYGSPTISLFNMKLMRYCKANKIKIVADCVDWLSVKTNNFLFDMVKRADNTYQKAYVNKKAAGVIAISSYLADYYNKQGCPTVIIPPLSPIEYVSIYADCDADKNTVITYAGLPFKKDQEVKDCRRLKDRIDKTIILLHQAKQRGCSFIFHIFGFNKKEYLQAIPSQQQYVEELGSNIIFHGQRPNEEVVICIAKSDFTILLRDVNRDTTAGFPTKVSESISYGTPVIVTKTSDLESYIYEGENGFFLKLDGNNGDELVKILSMRKAEIRKLKQCCIIRKLFLYSNYTEKMKAFLKEVLI